MLSSVLPIVSGLLGARSRGVSRDLISQLGPCLRASRQYFPFSRSRPVPQAAIFVSSWPMVLDPLMNVKDGGRWITKHLSSLLLYAILALTGTATIEPSSFKPNLPSASGWRTCSFLSAPLVARIERPQTTPSLRRCNLFLLKKGDEGMRDFKG
jgi:hypothetical protein